MKNLVLFFGLATLGVGLPWTSRADSNGNQIERSSMTVTTPIISSMTLSARGIPKLVVEFAPTRWDLPASTGSLVGFGQYLQNHPASKAEIIAFADHTGHGPANVELSQKRADAVAKYLENTFAISADRISAKGYGEVSDRTRNLTEAARQADRQAIGTIK